MDDPAEVRDLVPVEPQAPSVLKPAADVVEGFHAYKALQRQLDAMLPDCLLTIQHNTFRKKNYWRAIAVAFNIELELIEERREEIDGDWGYQVMYRATAPGGRKMEGDGSCFASEKHSNARTIHNVRAHAHTRAKNRAISDLCGFGEVSAEEVERDAPAARDPGQSHGTPTGQNATDKQIKMIVAKSHARAGELGFEGDRDKAHEIRKAARTFLGLDDDTRPLKSQVDAFVAAVANVQHIDGDFAIPDAEMFD